MKPEILHRKMMLDVGYMSLRDFLRITPCVWEARIPARTLKREWMKARNDFYIDWLRG